MNFYEYAFFSLISGCGLLTWRQYAKTDTAEEKPLVQNVTPQVKAEARSFYLLFLAVYCLVMASDWLQGIPSQVEL